MHMHTSFDLDGYKELVGLYSIPLVILSIILVCIASFVALSLNERIKHNSVFNQHFWNLLTSFAMGFGIWAMHYMGMFAFSLPIPIHYDGGLTVLSIFPPMLASFFAFHLINKPKLTFKVAVFSSILMGLGVFSMHAIGMASMELDAYHINNYYGAAFSMLSAIFAFFVFSSLYTYTSRITVRFIMAIIIGLSISATHYVSMFSMKFYVEETVVVGTEIIQMENLSVSVINLIIGLVVLICFLVYSNASDIYVEYRRKKFDSVTNLPNLTMLKRKNSKSEYAQIALWGFSDLSHVLNLGEATSDIFFNKLTHILYRHKTPSTDIYRVASDKFVIATKRTDQQFKVEMSALGKTLQHPIEVNGEAIVVSALCALSTIEHKTPTMTVYEAASNVFKSLEVFFNYQVITYNPDIHHTNFEEGIKHDISRAMKEQEMFLVYQPKILPHSNEIKGFEALLRWNHPRHGFLSPAIFIPILENTGLMQVITDWIIDQVCQQIKEWREAKIPFEHISINIPGNYVTSAYLVTVLDQAVSDYQLTPAEIELEITETSFVENLQEAMRAVSSFRDKGYSVALDDFGTGLSSLSYLKQMNISTLKIDKSFVDDVPSSKKDAAILQAIIALGESLHLEIVFEGVETKEQQVFIEKHCINPIIQGYYYSKPLACAEVLERYQQLQPN